MAGTGFYRNNSMVVFFCVFSVTVFVDVYQVFFVTLRAAAAHLWAKFRRRYPCQWVELPEASSTQ